MCRLIAGPMGPLSSTRVAIRAADEGAALAATSASAGRTSAKQHSSRPATKHRPKHRHGIGVERTPITVVASAMAVLVALSTMPPVRSIIIAPVDSGGMQYTTLGRTGLRVSVAGLGCGGNSRLGLGAGRSEQEAIALVRCAIDLGVNFFDTAEAYGTAGPLRPRPARARARPAAREERGKIRHLGITLERSAPGRARWPRGFLRSGLWGSCLPGESARR